MEYIAMVLWTRFAEKILALLIGGLSLWLGYKLFYRAAEERSKAEIEGGGFKFKAERIGPGVFFALFGSAISIYVVLSVTRLTLPDVALVNSPNPAVEPIGDKPDRVVTVTSAMGGDEIPPGLLAVNTLVLLKQRYPDPKTMLSSSDMAEMWKAIDGLAAVQRIFIDAKFGKGEGAKYEMFEKECSVNSELCRSLKSDQKSSEIHDGIFDYISLTLR